MKLETSFLAFLKSSSGNSFNLKPISRYSSIFLSSSSSSSRCIRRNSFVFSLCRACHSWHQSSLIPVLENKKKKFAEISDWNNIHHHNTPVAFLPEALLLLFPSISFWILLIHQTVHKNLVERNELIWSRKDRPERSVVIAFFFDATLAELLNRGDANVSTNDVDSMVLELRVRLRNPPLLLSKLQPDPTRSFLSHSLPLVSNFSNHDPH